MWRCLDQKEGPYWEKLLLMPFHTVLPPGTPKDAVDLLDPKGGSNACVLTKHTGVGNRRLDVLRTGDIITAFYFPSLAGLSEVKLSIAGTHITSWAPEGSGFHCPPLPELPIPREWEENQFDGVPYHRVVLMYPCIPCIAFMYNTIWLEFVFQEGKGQEFTYYSEYWMLNTNDRRFIANANLRWRTNRIPLRARVTPS